MSEDKASHISNAKHISSAKHISDAKQSSEPTCPASPSNITLIARVPEEDIVYRDRPPKVIGGHYLVGRELGQGSFGKVKEALDLRIIENPTCGSGMPGHRCDGGVAIKICDRKRLRKIPGGQESVKQEIAALRRLYPEEAILCCGEERANGECANETRATASIDRTRSNGSMDKQTSSGSVNKSSKRGSWERKKRSSASIAWASVNACNVVLMLDEFRDDEKNKLYIVLEKMTHGDLHSFVTAQHERLSMFQIRRMFIDLLNAVEYTHAHHVVHRDIKPSNLMLCVVHDEDGKPRLTLKLSDFGSAQILVPAADQEACAEETKYCGPGGEGSNGAADQRAAAKSDMATSANGDANEKSSSGGGVEGFASSRVSKPNVPPQRGSSGSSLSASTASNFSASYENVCSPALANSGSPAFQSPEVAAGDYSPAHAFESDIWAVGVCLYFMVTAKYPFMSDSVLSMLDAITECNYTVPEDVPPTVAHLIRLIMCKNSSDRPSIAYIRKHSWFSEELPEPDESVLPDPTPMLFSEDTVMELRAEHEQALETARKEHEKDARAAARAHMRAKCAIL